MSKILESQRVFLGSLDQRQIPVTPVLDETAEEQPAAVDERAVIDHARNPEAIAEAPCPRGRNDVAGRDRRQHRGADRNRLAEPLRDVENDEETRSRKRPLPCGVADEEATHLGLGLEDAPAVRDVRAHALEDAVRRPRLLVDVEDRRTSRRHRSGRGDQERRGVPEVEQKAAADQPGADRQPAQKVLLSL